MRQNLTNNPFCMGECVRITGNLHNSILKAKNDIKSFRGTFDRDSIVEIHYKLGNGQTISLNIDQIETVSIG